MNYPEAVAKRVLETVLSGASLDYRLNQSNGEHDFDLRWSDGAIDAVEVTASVDQVQAATIGAIRSKRRGGSVIPTIKCRKSWVIFPIKGARINQIRQNADDYLFLLEKDNVERFFWPQRGPESVREICTHLQISGGGEIASEPTPSIRIALPGGGGAVGRSCATEAAEREAWKQDNRRKLGAAGTSVRHLVVYVDAMNGLPWVALTSFEPPSQLPTLPPEITDLWIIAHAENANEFIAWRGGQDQLWRSVHLICP